jgi:hypothetical protein
MSGLNSDQRIVDQFAKDLQKIQANWQNMTAPERLSALKLAINSTLNAAGLPTCDVRGEKMSGDTVGQFIPEGWILKVDSDLLNQPKLSNKDASDLGETLYHEARHSEQSYRIAQMLASQPPDGQKRTPQQIANELSFGSAIKVAQRATQSVQNTPLSPAQLQAANAWYQSMYGTGRNHTLQVYNQLATARQAYQKADHAFNTAMAKAQKLSGPVPPQTMAQLERLLNQVKSTLKAYQTAEAAYRQLPAEADAFRVEDRVGNAFNRRLNSERSGHRADANLNEPLDFSQLQQTYKQYAELVRPTLATGATPLNLDQAIAYALSRSGYTPDQRAQIIAAGSDNIPGNRTQAHAYVQQTANWPGQRTQQPVQIAQRQQ